ncbi:MAG: NADPH-dependent F420 reductase [Chloroflexi bacterium]|nr:NADPH-dependent F420 reductase [Chloroflexota bacterium]
MIDLDLASIAVLGGTGREGKGLAYRLAKAGYRILIGSRSPEKAVAVAGELTSLLGPGADVRGASNLEAARLAGLVVLTVPYAAHRETLESIREAVYGKIVVDVTVPLVPPKVTMVQMPPAGSAALEARQVLGESVSLAAAFQNISYELLLTDEQIECDVLVTGDSKATRAAVLKLVHAAGLTGWDAGPLENSLVAEGMTSILIGFNKQYGATHAGFRITGVQREEGA